MVIEGEEEWEVEKIMNKRKVQGRDVQWRRILGRIKKT